MKTATAIDRNGNVWTVEKIRQLLLTNDQAVVAGLKKIFEFQTRDEQLNEMTRHHNKIGFNGVDAFILTQFVKFHNAHGYLSPKQMGIARKKMVKYSAQLLATIGR